MKRRRSILQAMPVLMGLPWLCAPAAAQEPDQPIEETQEQGEAAANATERLILPIPLSNPTMGTGAALTVVKIYEPAGAGKPWTTGGGVMYTSHKDKAIGAFHNMSIANDRFRISVIGGYASLPLKFFGVGPDAGDRGVSIDIQQDVLGGRVEALLEAARDLHVGVRISAKRVKTGIRTDPDNPPPVEIPAIQLETGIVAAGPSIVFERTDAPFNPKNGVLVEARWLFGIRALGSDYGHGRGTFAANSYREIGEGSVLASRVSLCAAGSGAPYYDLCNYGQSNDLRGYLSGQYRDRASFAVQVELRQRLWGKFGGVVFAGIGGIAPSLGRLNESKILPAGGAGLRYELSSQYRINASVDIAYGRDSHAIYFSIGEAF